MNRVALCSSEPGLQPASQALASELGLPWIPVPDNHDFEALLILGSAGLQLQVSGPDAPGPIAVDFGGGQMRHRRRGGQNELLGRAVGVGKWPDLSVLDGTAGLGRDGFVLADLGCRVTLFERSPLVFALLRDGLERARNSDDSWLRETGARMQLVTGDSSTWMRDNPDGVDTVYLDPMFPPRKKSARVKKEMWIFQHLLDETIDPALLLDPALACARRRVVVKRPGRAPVLGDREPHFQLGGKTVRFDVYTAS